MFEKQITIAGVQDTITVTQISVKETSDLFGEKAALPLIIADGFAVTYITEEIIAACKEAYVGNDAALSAISQSVTGHAVTVLTDIEEQMDARDATAVFLHELGHVVHGHMKNLVESKTMSIKGGPVYMMDQEAELEADAYAAEQVGYHRVLSGLNAVLQAQANLISKLTGKPVEPIHAKISEEVKASSRYQELLKYTEGY